MESAGVVRTLAEPNLTAISGESATFIAGGEFPIPDRLFLRPGSRGACTTQISFKKFGISLNFTPVVLTEGRISLRVMTEVSGSVERQLDHAAQAVTPSASTPDHSLDQDPPRGNHAGNSVGRLRWRWPGLIQEQTKQAINGLPGLTQLPVLGTLFRSRDFVNNQTELMVLVTPLCRARGRAEGPVAPG